MITHVTVTQPTTLMNLRCGISPAAKMIIFVVELINPASLTSPHVMVTSNEDKHQLSIS